MSRTIISLTSYGNRVSSVHLVIQSLKNQEAEYDELILWLDESEFTANNLPSDLADLQDERFKIKYCENLKSYKKLIPTLIEYPNDTIITFDDDIVIPKDVVSKMLMSHQKHPKSIIANRGRIIGVSNRGFKPYGEWKAVNNNNEIYSRFCILPIGFGGVLYPANSLSKSVLDKDTFLSIADNADDIWFKCMSLLVRTPVVLLPMDVTANFRYIEGSQDNALFSTLNIGERNTEVINEVCSRFDGLKSLFSEEEFDHISIKSDGYLELHNRPKLFESTDDAVTFFIKSAIKVEKNDVLTAKKLIELALCYRPNGELLRKKLREYRNRL